MKETLVGVSSQDGRYVGGRGNIEQHLLHVFRTLLNVQQISATDNFFLLGGHSLVGTRVIARIRDYFGVEVSLQTLFDSPSVEALAREVEKLIADGAMQRPDDSRRAG